MSDLHLQLWQAFNDISFDEVKHKYTDSLGTRYQSATGWIKQFCPEVDWDEKAKTTAAKRGVDPAALKAEWDRSGDYARNLGTQLHSVMENLWYKKDYRLDERLLEKFPEMKEDFDWRKQNVCLPLFNKMKKVYVPIANEFIVYDQPNGICGTIDFIAYNTKSNSYAIIDWKTSKRFDTNNYYGEHLKAPFDDIESCNTTEYALQLSLYKVLLERKTNMNISELLLFQIPGKDSPIPQVHRCLDLSDRIDKILK